MSPFEINPNQKAGSHNPYMAVIMPDQTYGEIDGGYITFKGKALITPPIENIPEDCLEDICDDTGVQIDPTHLSETGTIMQFTAEYEESSEEDGDQEVLAAFKQLVNCLGRAAARANEQ